VAGLPVDGQPCAQLVAEGQLGGGEGQVHGVLDPFGRLPVETSVSTMC
jgi:hypothetical protein